MACMTAPDPAAGLDRLDALITPDLWQYVDGMNTAAVVGWGTMFNVAHLVRGIRTLHAAGQCYAALPLMRSLMEYTLGTMWLADAGEDAVHVLNRKLQNSHGRLLTDLGDIDLEASFPAEAVQSFRDVLDAQLDPHPDDRLNGFAHLLKEYGYEKNLPVYDVFSGIAHFSLTGAEMFFRGMDGAFALSLEPNMGEVAPCEVICLGMQFDTMFHYNELLISKPWTADLAAIAEDHDLPGILATRKGTSRTSAPSGKQQAGAF
jgi:hypothetical protein